MSLYHVVDLFLQASVLEVLLAAELSGFRHRDSVEAGLQALSSRLHDD